MPLTLTYLTSKISKVMQSTTLTEGEILGKVLDFASKAHGKQRRKFSDELYIHHPIRVMNTCKEFTENVHVLAAALLHDVLEDTAVSKDELRKYLASYMDKYMANKTMGIVEELTDVYTKKNYPQLNRRARKELEAKRLSRISADAQSVKYADILDNAQNIKEHSPGFAIVYLREGRILLTKMTKGNSKLYTRAVRLLDGAIKEIEMN